VGDPAVELPGRFSPWQLPRFNGIGNPWNGVFHQGIIIEPFVKPSTMTQQCGLPFKPKCRAFVTDAPREKICGLKGGRQSHVDLSDTGYALRYWT
jgi:hypothetical protein